MAKGKTTIAQRVRLAHECVAAALVQRFEGSGVEYTSRAAVLSVIDDAAMPLIVKAERECGLHGRLKARRAINLACERIHAERGTNA